MRTIYDGGEPYDQCNLCDSSCRVASGVPDVYWPGQPHYNDNLVDKATGKPVLLTSKRHKAEVMKKLGVVEAGDRYHGAPYVPSGNWRE